MSGLFERFARRRYGDDGKAPHRFQRSLEQRARVSLVVNDEQAQPFKFRRAVKGRVAARRTLRTS